jgi:hypothetical protein
MGDKVFMPRFAGPTYAKRCFRSICKSVKVAGGTDSQATSATWKGGTHGLVCFCGFMRLEAGLLAGFGQRFEIIPPAHISQKNVLPAVTPAHDVVNGTGIFNSYSARHGTKDAFLP